jgi:hypothetical protein
MQQKDGLPAQFVPQVTIGHFEHKYIRGGEELDLKVHIDFSWVNSYHTPGNNRYRTS